MSTYEDAGSQDLFPTSPIIFTDISLIQRDIVIFDRDTFFRMSAALFSIIIEAITFAVGRMSSSTVAGVFFDLVTSRDTDASSALFDTDEAFNITVSPDLNSDNFCL